MFGSLTFSGHTVFVTLAMLSIGAFWHYVSLKNIDHFGHFGGIVGLRLVPSVLLLLTICVAFVKS